MPITLTVHNPSPRESRRALQSVIPILDDEAGAEARDLAGETGETDED